MDWFQRAIRREKKQPVIMWITCNHSTSELCHLSFTIPLVCPIGWKMRGNIVKVSTCCVIHLRMYQQAATQELNEADIIQLYPKFFNQQQQEYSQCHCCLCFRKFLSNWWDEHSVDGLCKTKTKKSQFNKEGKRQKESNGTDYKSFLNK